MTTVLILALAALVCVFGVFFFAMLTLQFRHEEPINIILFFATILCASGCCWCIVEIVKRDTPDHKRSCIESHNKKIMSM